MRRLAKYGIDGRDIARFKKAGLDNLTVDQVIDLARHGVSGRDAARALKKGVKSVAEIIELARHGKL